MTTEINVSKHLRFRMLVTREAARNLEPFVRQSDFTASAISFDLNGIAGMTPSFFDEILIIMDEVTGNQRKIRPDITIRNPPTEPSRKFQTVAKAHNRSLLRDHAGNWRLAPMVGPKSRIQP